MGEVTFCPGLAVDCDRAADVERHATSFLGDCPPDGQVAALAAHLPGRVGGGEVASACHHSTGIGALSPASAAKYQALLGTRRSQPLIMTCDRTGIPEPRCDHLWQVFNRGGAYTFDGGRSESSRKRR